MILTNTKKRWYLLPSLFLLCWSCQFSVTPQPDYQQIDALSFQVKRLQQYDSVIYPTLMHQVQTGDMVLRSGSDMTSEMLRQMNQTDKRYSHCGIASIENDTVFVYHAIGGEFNPDQRIKREPLYSFCHAADNKAAAIFRPLFPASKNRVIATQANQFWLQGIPFDMAFDYHTEDRFYCAEFVAKTIARAVADSSWFTFSTAGKMQYVGVDNLLLSPVMKTVVEKNY
ncbi:YiiX/YebB-like N1pC/P60 family cysteine hydrolase [Phnomibacter sp. MR]|uniref:YiiX/YebB-like N1pC/P60 family cysteine hydrolase n=1 Tax=Phnomibacter sp. MR TaxID=3042318 RepID=UPI003A7FC308